MKTPDIVDLGLSLGRRRGRIAAVAALCALGLSDSFGATAALERAALYLRDMVRDDAASGDVVVVEIDARSLARFDRWPWPRSLHGEAVRAAARSGAASIAFDVDFSARSTAREDAAFATALAEAGINVILPTFRQQAGGGSRGDVESLPVDAFRRHVLLGAVNIRPDADGVVRRMPVGVFTSQTPRPSLPAMIAGVAGRADESFPIDYAIDAATIPRLSFADLVGGRVPPERIAGRNLIVGATAIEMGDRYVVPRFGVIPGVIIQALAAETLGRGGIPVEGGRLPALAVAALALALAFRSRSRLLRRMVPPATATALFACALVCEAAWGVHFDIAAGLMTLATGSAAFALLGHVARLARERLHDGATGLANARALERAADPAAAMHLCVAAIGRHQEIGAMLGPGRLDELMLRVAERLEAVATGGQVFRIEEAALAWTMDEQALDTLDAGFAGLHAVMRAPFFAAGRPVDLPITFGVASGSGADARRLAIGALSAASRAADGGERWARFQAESDEAAAWQLSLLSELDTAMESGAVWIAYQPKLDLRTGTIKGAEALVRWRHPVRGNIPPDQFIPLVEARGQMMELTLHVLARALSDAEGLAAAGHPINVAVNLSTTLLHRPGLAESIFQSLARTGASPERLTLEVTESAAVELSPEIVAALQALRNAGIRISVDDYGTGQSTMSYLKAFPAQELKIDKSFVQAMPASRSDQILVRSTIEMAHQLGLTVIAEGVEDAETLATLRDFGCDAIQGYHVAKPMPLPDLMTLLNQERTPPAVAA